MSDPASAAIAAKRSAQNRLRNAGYALRARTQSLNSLLNDYAENTTRITSGEPLDWTNHLSSKGFDMHKILSGTAGLGLAAFIGIATPAQAQDEPLECPSFVDGALVTYTGSDRFHRGEKCYVKNSELYKIEGSGDDRICYYMHGSSPGCELPGVDDDSDIWWAANLEEVNYFGGHRGHIR